MLFKWTAMDRPYKKWTKDFYSTVIVLAFLISVILFFIEGLLPVMVVWAVVFMMWQMNKVEPQETDYVLTNWGLKTKDKTTRWEEMAYFWFDNKLGSRVLRVVLNEAPWQLILVIHKKDEDDIRKIIGERVIYEVPRPTASDKMVKWLGEKMPME